MTDAVELEADLIRDLQLLKECLELRLSLIGQNNSLKTEFELNEDDIIRIKTKVELNKLNALIIQKTHDFRANLKMTELEQIGI
jgi:hypothetical protein